MADQHVNYFVSDAPAERASADPEPPRWDRRATRFTSTRNVWRGPIDADGNPDGEPFLAGPGEELVLQASYSKEHRRWLGPEARHVEQLLSNGGIGGIARAAEMALEQQVIEREWGAHGGGRDGEPLRPELRHSTKAQLIDWTQRGDPNYGFEPG